MLLLVGPFFAGIPPALPSVDTLANQKKETHVDNNPSTACSHASNMSLHSSYQGRQVTK